MEMNGKTALITGASSGIGFETAKHLASAGWRVIATGRDAGRCKIAAAAIRSASTAGAVDMIRVDLSRMKDTARASAEIAALTDRIDVLINNAGCMAKEKVITEEGLEENFAGNHLGPFLLTTKLLSLLRRAAKDVPAGSVRIINTSSDASEMVPSLPWNDLLSLDNFRPGAAYCYAKLANVLFARGLAQRLAPDGIVAHAMHPGVVDSNFINSADPHAQATIRKLKALPPAEAADTLIWLATADEPGRSTGGYFYQRAPRKMNLLAEDPAAVEQLWQETEKLLANVGY